MNSIGIVTISSLPWLTGTSILPLFHAVYLKKRGYETTLYVPWLPPSQQHHCFADHRFTSSAAQRDYIKKWLPETLRDFCPDIRFYPSKYYKFAESIGPLVDLDRLIDDHDIIILEDPEHLFASHPGSRIKRNRLHVIGIVMTHYEYYHSQHIPPIFAKGYQYYSRFLLQRMCHRLLAISAVQKDVCSLPMAQVVPLNGVSPLFFKSPPPCRNSRCYFMGKLIPEKGIEEMYKLLQAVGVSEIDLYGYGKVEWAIKLAEQYGLQPIYKGISHKPWEDLPEYKIFINCSRSEYLCTTTANAIVMQQWAIVPEHPSNQFYYQFQNCLTYATSDDFVKQFNTARDNEPASDPGVAELTWDATINRLIGIIQNTLHSSKRIRRAS